MTVPNAPDDLIPVDALQTALAAEHTAIWAYGLAAAFVADRFADQLTADVTEHRARRDATERFLLDSGVQPVPAEPGYLIPTPVTDGTSARELIVTVENDVAAAWRSVIERSPAEPRVRQAALDALTLAAVRATRWRMTLGTTPVTVPFPGAP